MIKIVLVWCRLMDLCLSRRKSSVHVTVKWNSNMNTREITAFSYKSPRNIPIKPCKISNLYNTFKKKNDSHKIYLRMSFTFSSKFILQSTFFLKLNVNYMLYKFIILKAQYKKISNISFFKFSVAVNSSHLKTTHPS